MKRFIKVLAIFDSQTLLDYEMFDALKKDYFEEVLELFQQPEIYQMTTSVQKMSPDAEFLSKSQAFIRCI